MNENIFEYTYSSNIKKEVEEIRRKYVVNEEDKMAKLRRLDKKVERKGTIISVIIGTMGMLLFGLGLTLCLEFSDTLFTKGILVGVLGIIFVTSALPCHKYITKKQRKKFAPQIIALSNEILK